MVVLRSDEARTRGCIRRNRMLRSLDLGVLPRDDSGPLSELQVCWYKANVIGRVCISTAAPERSLFPLQARRQKFAFFEKDCSLVSTLRRCLAH